MKASGPHEVVDMTAQPGFWLDAALVVLVAVLWGLVLVWIIGGRDRDT